MTAFHTQPTMWALLLSLPAFDFMPFNHLTKVVVSGSLCSSALASKIQEKTGATLLNAYGLIEATGVVTVTHPEDSDDVRLNSVGRPIPGVELKIVDENRQTLPNGETGELAVKGYLMKGYYKKEEKTGEVIDDEGWLYTGDLACYCEDNKNIRIVGRIKDMVIRGGFNVYPIDIEECLLTSEDIEDVSVVGKEDEILGERLIQNSRRGLFCFPISHFIVRESSKEYFKRMGRERYTGKGKTALYRYPAIGINTKNINIKIIDK